MKPSIACGRSRRFVRPFDSLLQPNPWHLIASSAALLALASAGCEKKAEVVQLPPPEVSVSQPLERPVAEYFETTGQVSAVESVEIRARVSGYLTKVGFRDGTEVKEGTELFVIDPRPYQAEVERSEAEVARWEASQRKSVADVDRNKRLLPKGAASEKDLESSVAARDSAVAEIEGAKAKLDKAKLDLEFTRVTAPISGQISRTNVTVGNLIQVSATQSNVLTTLVSVDPIYVYFDIDERTMLQQRERRRNNGMPVGGDAVRLEKIPVEIGLASDEGYPYSGILDFIDNRVDPGTGTIKARGLFTNPHRVLTPGLFVRVRVPISDPRAVLLVTERAIGTDQGNKFVYVVNDKGAVEYRAVKLGAKSDDGLRALTQGVNAGEWVMVNGIQRSRPGMTVKPQQVSMIVPAAPAAAPPKPAQEPKASDAAKPHA
jgi:membrane fusion protein, multidrug efflux system